MKKLFTHAFVRNLPIVVVDGLEKREVGVEQHICIPGKPEEVFRILFGDDGNLVKLVIGKGPDEKIQAGEK